MMPVNNLLTSSILKNRILSLFKNEQNSASQLRQYAYHAWQARYAILLTTVLSTPGYAAEYTVGTFDALKDAIIQANATFEHDTVHIQNDIVLTDDLPWISGHGNVVFTGGEQTQKTISGDGKYRIFFVELTANKTVEFSNLKLENGFAQGGTGAQGGGGGAGMGAALFIYGEANVQNAKVIVKDVAFFNNKVIGGEATPGAGGGGGGLGGNGGNGHLHANPDQSSGGGGGGFSGHGGQAGSHNGQARGGGGGGFSGNGGDGAISISGGSGFGLELTALHSSNDGRGADGAGHFYDFGVTGSKFGGGGGGGTLDGGNGGDFGGGGGSIYCGGTGGFGGGGGSGITSGYYGFMCGYGAGGAGGFGGGQGGFAGSRGDGGSGFGGAIFAMVGQLTLKGVQFIDNSAEAGQGQSAGEEKGNALFICSSQDDKSCNAKAVACTPSLFFGNNQAVYPSLGAIEEGECTVDAPPPATIAFTLEKIEPVNVQPGVPTQIVLVKPQFENPENEDTLLHYEIVSNTNPDVATPHFKYDFPVAGGNELILENFNLTDITTITIKAFTEDKASEDDTSFIVSVSAPPLLIELEQFTAAARNKNIVLKWTTATETETAGFHIWRAICEEAEKYTQITRVTDKSIKARGTYKAYTYVDNKAVKPGATYCYALVEVNMAGEEKLYDPIISAKVAAQ